MRKSQRARIDRLIVEHMPRAGQIAGAWIKRLAHSQYLHAEIESAARWGLVQAAHTWRRGRGASFRAHAARRIEGAIKDVLRLEDPVSHYARALERQGVPLRDSVIARVLMRGEMAEELLGGAPCAPTQFEAAALLELTERLYRAMLALKPRQARVLLLHWWRGLTMKEIGRVLGVTEARICQIERDAFIELRSALFDSRAE